MTSRRRFLGAAAVLTTLSGQAMPTAAEEPEPPETAPTTEVGDLVGGVTADKTQHDFSVAVAIDQCHDGREWFKYISLELATHGFTMDVSLDDERARELGRALLQAADAEGEND